MGKPLMQAGTGKPEIRPNLFTGYPQEVTYCVPVTSFYLTKGHKLQGSTGYFSNESHIISNIIINT
jgi:hypothetical protein